MGQVAPRENIYLARNKTLWLVAKQQTYTIGTLLMK